MLDTSTWPLANFITSLFPRGHIVVHEWPTSTVFSVPWSFSTDDLVQVHLVRNRIEMTFVLGVDQLALCGGLD